MSEYISLTEFEIEGLISKYNFADGHAYHSMPEILLPVIENLSSIWTATANKPIPTVEEEFKLKFANAIGSKTLSSHKFYSIAPTASNSIDIAATLLKSQNCKVGLLEPAFDNLYLILNRRGVEVSSIQEQDLNNLNSLEQKIEENKLNSLFIVNPNNPTGTELNETEFTNLVGLCAKRGITLILDTTFRFYSKQSFDSYEVLEKSGVDFIVIEDTGKTWPTQDMKASLMTYSGSLAQSVRELYEEIYLCSSSFSLAVLGNLIERTMEAGIDKVIWNEVDNRRSFLRGALLGSKLELVEHKGSCAMPVAWLDATKTHKNDFEIVESLSKHGISLLPGRFFYWNSKEMNTNNVRLSLMRPDNTFHQGITALKSAIPHV